MPIFLLIGHDQYQIQQQITKLKSRLNPSWLAFNTHAYSAEELSDAISSAHTIPIMDDRRLVVIENCQFNQFTERHFDLLQCLSHLPKQTILIFTSHRVDKRMKVVKELLKVGELREFDTIPPWRMDLIGREIATQARQYNLPLSQPVMAYLATAIGNDRSRIEVELKKLTVYANENPLTLIDAKHLISNTTYNILQLAEAIRTGNTNQVVKLLTQLLFRAEAPLLILSTLITQFHIWLWVKSALMSSARLKDAELAECCGISNPKRLYYLRHEVATISLHALTQTVTELLNLETCIKQGESSEVLLLTFVKLARLLKG